MEWTLSIHSGATLDVADLIQLSGVRCNIGEIGCKVTIKFLAFASFGNLLTKLYGSQIISGKYCRRGGGGSRDATVSV